MRQQRTRPPSRRASRAIGSRAIAARLAVSAAAVAAVATLASCGGGSPARSVPSAPSAPSGQGAPSAPGGSPSPVSHAQALHLAGQCIREHGILAFPDPAVDSAGQVTISKAQLLAVPKPVLAQAMSTCRGALDRAGIQAGHLHGTGSPPTPQQLRAILAFARCMRAHGLPGLADPNPRTGQISLPPGVSKTSPVLQAAGQACRRYLPGSG